VLGGSGWFGRTALNMIGVQDADVLVVGSYARNIEVNGKAFYVRPWDATDIKRFQPDLVLDFAFLTRDLIRTLGEQEFARQNLVLSERLLSLNELGSVRTLFSVSSGAATLQAFESGANSTDLYGEQKLANEGALREIALSGATNVIIARAWSVTGGHVLKPRNYAFSDFILSGLEDGQIVIRAPHPVTRRYCAVEDFLAVALASGLDKQITDLDSGGPLVELEELARVIAEKLGNPSVKVSFPDRSEVLPDNYHSSGTDWESAASNLGFEPLSLSGQVVNVRDSLR